MPLLPAAPTDVVMAGEPVHGRYAGRIDHIDWGPLQGPHARPAWWRHLHHKRWQYVGIGNAEVFIGVAIVDLGWMCTAFAYAFDRVRREVVANWRQDGLLGLQGGVSDQPVNGSLAWFTGPFSRLRIEHDAQDDTLEVSVRTPAMKLQVDLSLANAAPFLLGIGPVAGGVAHATQKSSALPVSGWLNVRGRRFDLSDAVACLDSSNGLLARDTDWRWACAHSDEVGFNLQQGYFGSNENALWLDGQLIPLGEALFEFDPNQPMASWRVRTDDGLLDLVFTPEGARQEDRDVWVASSHYVQPVGTFDGRVKSAPGALSRRVSALLGVTEDHRSRW